MAGTPFPNQVPALANAFGTERILYGSDYCWTSAPAVARQIATVDTAPANGTTWRATTAANGARLLTGLDDPHPR